MKYYPILDKYFLTLPTKAHAIKIKKYNTSNLESGDLRRITTMSVNIWGNRFWGNY